MLYYTLTTVYQEAITMRPYILLFYLLSTLLSASDDTYKLGKGIQLGTLPLYIGGYFSLGYEHVYGKERTLELDELALMLYGEYNHFSYMLELEGEDVYTEFFGDETRAVHQENIHLERLYLNYSFNENYDITLGKFNSTVGLWNQDPINVLRDTSSSPALTTQLFPKFTSGAVFQYQTLNAQTVTYQLTLQEGEDLDKLFNREEIYNNFDTDRHYGIGISWTNDEMLYQLNAGYFNVRGGDAHRYLLGAFRYEQPNYKLQGEWGIRFDEESDATFTSGYFQGLYRVASHHEAILRFENYDDRHTGTEDSFAVLGYTYRPYYPVAIKGEYQWHSYREENKLILSLSVLF
jgi:hypothetical protein